MARVKPTILIVDDHVEMARLLADQLGDAGYAPTVAASGVEAVALVKTRSFDVVVSDLRMEEVDGIDVLDAVHAVDPMTPVLIMTAFGGIESAVQAIKRGAYHYVAKPFQLDEVLVYVERALDERRVRDDHRALRRWAAERAGFGVLIGKSPAMQKLYALLERVAQSQAPVLIRGESGTGKERVARALHFEGPRKAAAFVAVNCTALPESLLESELFGHVRGAFTGATSSRRGLFAEADGGTLLLDEIGDMPPALQAKLLRVLEEGEVRAVGSDAPRKVDVRIVAATHQDLEERVRSGGFRQDLYYRLAVVPVAVPPLRDRIEDLPLLAEHFLARARERNPSSPVQRLAREAVAALGRWSWPGNVRELENLIERLVVIGVDDVVQSADVQALLPSVPGSAPLDDAKRAMVTLDQLEREYITWVISQCGGNKTRAAEILGIDVSTIYRRQRGSH
ncbi:MAG: DNA-binding response regulator [Myxococcales bacterium]|nr:DNA-binding response regulator [Myxococcales bacterium]